MDHEVDQINDLKSAVDVTGIVDPETNAIKIAVLHELQTNVLKNKIDMEMAKDPMHDQIKLDKMRAKRDNKERLLRDK